MNNNDKFNDIFTKKSGNIYPSILFIVLIALILGIYGGSALLSKNNKSDKKGNAVEPTPTATVTPTSSPTPAPTPKLLPPDETKAVLKNQKKELTIGGITRTVERKECKTYIDGNLIFEDTLDCTGDIYVLFDNLIVMSKNEGVSFYNANLEKIDYVMDTDYSYINAKMTKIPNSDNHVPILIQNDKVVVEGNSSNLTAPIANINGQSYDICVEENGKRHLNSVLEGKLKSAKYELTYDNNKLEFNRISGTEDYYTEEMCNY
jgi:hypothetical protein